MCYIKIKFLRSFGLLWNASTKWNKRNNFFLFHCLFLFLFWPSSMLFLIPSSFSSYRFTSFLTILLPLNLQSTIILCLSSYATSVSCSAKTCVQDMRSPYNYMSCPVSVCKTASGFVLQGDVSYLTDTRSGSSCGTPISRSSSVSRNPTLTTTRSATSRCSWAQQPSCTAVWGIWESARWVQKCVLPVMELAYAFSKHRWFWCN
jgi:hypothetical protein